MALLVRCADCKSQRVDGEDCYNDDCPSNRDDDDDFDDGGMVEVISDSL